MSDPNSYLDAMMAARDAVEGRLQSNPDYLLLRQIEKALQAHGSGSLSAVRLSQTDAAYAVLVEIGRPLPIGDLLDIVARNGINVGGANPNTNFSSALSRDSRFKSVHWSNSRRWWVSDRPMPPEPRREHSNAMAVAQPA
jgi:hypothetical protein